MAFYGDPRLSALPSSVLSVISMILAQVAGGIDENLLVETLVGALLSGATPAGFLQAVLDKIDTIMVAAPVWEKRGVVLFLGWAIQHLTPAAT